MNNQTFLESLGVTDEKTLQTCLEAMAKYGDNKWWEPDVDLRTYAYHQLHEDLLLRADIGDLSRGLAEIVGRGVYTHELVDPELKQEVERAWRWGIGCVSEQEASERVEASIDRLAKKVKEHGGKLIQFNIPSE